MATKKTTAPAAKVETKVEAPVKAEVKAEPVKAEAKKAPAKKAEPEKEVAKKETVKKETTKKAATTKKAVKTAVVVQFGGQEISMDVVVENVKKAFEAEGNKVSAIKDLQVYVKPEEYAAYYVINQDITGKINLF
ncbi:MAG: hypothetical protein IJZ23_02960 [Roseburia sp.]|nr:hypothetical protein [Roseburia sp.]